MARQPENRHFSQLRGLRLLALHRTAPGCCQHASVVHDSGGAAGACPPARGASRESTPLGTARAVMAAAPGDAQARIIILPRWRCRTVSRRPPARCRLQRIATSAHLCRSFQQPVPLPALLALNHVVTFQAAPRPPPHRQAFACLHSASKLCPSHCRCCCCRWQQGARRRGRCRVRGRRSPLVRGAAAGPWARSAGPGAGPQPRPADVRP